MRTIQLKGRQVSPFLYLNIRFTLVMLLISIFALKSEGQCVVNAGVDQCICNGESVTLSAIPSGGTGPYTFEWESIPDYGPYPGTQNITVNPTTIGPFTQVVYTVTIHDASLPLPCSDSDQVTITVYSQCLTSAFSFSPSISQCSGSPIQFTGPSSTLYPGIQYLWDFGDGQTATIENPQHSFESIGYSQEVFAVTLTTNWCGDISTTTQNVIVDQLPDATLVASPGWSQCTQ